MAKKIALFNHKGGVSKTTTTFNLGWMLAELGKRVVLVDADPQCNLTGMVLDFRGPRQFEEFYEKYTMRNIKAGLSPAFEAKPKIIDPVDCLPVNGRDGLFLLPGHIGLAEYDITLGISQQLSGPIQTLQNLPGSILYLLDKTAEKFSADYILIDMSPSLSSINQNIFLISDYFILPTSPDYFSVMAIESLSVVFPKWHQIGKSLSSMSVLQQADYPFPEVKTKFLGTIIQRYRPRGGAPASAFKSWADEIGETVTRKLIPSLQKSDMMLQQNVYGSELIQAHYALANIADFNSLIAKSQKYQTPVYKLTAEQIGQAGAVLSRSEASRDNFKKVFLDLAEKIFFLTDHV